MATLPTFVAEYEAAWNSGTTPKTSASFNASAGDVLVCIGMAAGTGGSLNTPTNTQGALTWTLTTSQVPASSNTRSYLWTATVDAAKTGMTVSVTRGGSAVWWGMTVFHLTGTAGIGAANSGLATAAPSLALTTTGDNSAICVGAADFNAGDGTARAWRSVNGSGPTELTYFRDVSWYTTYAGTYLDAGTAGAKTVGLTTPSMKYTIVAVEILGTSGTDYAGSATGTGASTGSAGVQLLLSAGSTGTGATTGSAAATATLVASATGSGATTGTATAGLSQGATASGSGTTAGSATAALLIPVSATGTGVSTGSAAATITSGATSYSASATGTGQTAGSASATLTAVAAATGTGQTTGTAAALINLAASATGTGTTTGSAAATLQTGLSGTATGTGTTSGSAATISNLAATATGLGQTAGSAAALINLAAQATGLGVTDGTAAATATLVAAAVGAGTSSGTATATILSPPPNILPVVFSPGELGGPVATGGAFGGPTATGGTFTAYATGGALT